MAKGTFVGDTFEQLAEMGKSTAKASVKAVAQTFNPLQPILETKGAQKSGDKGMEKIEQAAKKAGNHTPLDFDKLQKNYGNQDAQKAQVLRNRLFQLVKGGEEKAIYEKKREEEEKKRKEAYEDREKKRREQQIQAQQQQSGTPHGKERKSIFSAKKVAKREQTEVKPASGKQ